MTIVSNSSVLISLSKIGRIDLLRRKFGKILVPRAVWREIVEEGGARPAAKEVKEAGWIDVATDINEDVKSALMADLDQGEAEAIALARNLRADRLLIDEKAARRHAERHGVAVVGTLGILVLAKRNGLIPSVRHEIESLRTAPGFRFSDALVRMALLEVGEE